MWLPLGQRMFFLIYAIRSQDNRMDHLQKRAAKIGSEKLFQTLWKTEGIFWVGRFPQDSSSQFPGKSKLPCLSVT